MNIGVVIIKSDFSGLRFPGCQAFERGPDDLVISLTVAAVEGGFVHDHALARAAGQGVVGDHTFDRAGFHILYRNQWLLAGGRGTPLQGYAVSPKNGHPGEWLRPGWPFRVSRCRPCSYDPPPWKQRFGMVAHPGLARQRRSLRNPLRVPRKAVRSCPGSGR